MRFFGAMRVVSVFVSVKYLQILLLFCYSAGDAKSTFDEPLPSSDIVPAKLCPKCQKLESGLFERFIIQYVDGQDLVLKMSK